MHKQHFTLLLASDSSFPSLMYNSLLVACLHSRRRRRKPGVEIRCPAFLSYALSPLSLTVRSERNDLRRCKCAPEHTLKMHRSLPLPSLVHRLLIPARQASEPKIGAIAWPQRLNGNAKQAFAQRKRRECIEAVLGRRGDGCEIHCRRAPDHQRRGEEVDG